MAGAFVVASPPAQADTSYVGSSVNRRMISLDIVSGRQGVPVAVFDHLSASAFPAGPTKMVITPDGRTVYAITGDTVTPVDTATNTAGAGIPVRNAWALAISPDGRTVLVTSIFKVTPIDTATNVAGPPIQVDAGPSEIAIAPDGRTAYVTTVSTALTPIDLATRTLGTPIALAAFGSALGITPDGRTAVVAEASHVQLVELQTGQAEAPVLVGDHAVSRIAIAPNGKTAYLALDPDGPPYSPASVPAKVVPFDLSSRTVGASVLEARSSLSSLAVTGDSTHLLATLPCVEDDTCDTSAVLDRDLTTDAAPRSLSVDNLKANSWGTGTTAAPDIIVLAPSPSATFTAVSAATGSAATFDAAGSGNVGGSVTGYAWQFGDGATGAGATVNHVYTQPGTYTVTLTTTNTGGCAATMRYTGQMTSCTGSPTATTTRTILVTSTPAAARTASALSVSRTRATMRGTITAAGGPATYHFDYGTTTRYGRSTPVQTLPSQHGSVSVRARVTKLSPNRRYHYRLVVSTPQGAGRPSTPSFGGDIAFTTRATGTLRLQSRTRRLVRSTVVIPLRCSSSTSCRGRLKLTTRRGNRTITCATGNLRIAAKHTTRKRVRVRTACRSLLRHAKRHRLTTRVTTSLTTGQKEITGVLRLRR